MAFTTPHWTSAKGFDLLAYVDTLYYLWKGGRVPGLAHLATSLLQLKPIFELELSNITQVARPRTVAHAVSKVVTLMKERTGEGPLHAMVMHAQAPEQADSLSSQIASEFECEELFVVRVYSSDGGTHWPGNGWRGILELMRLHLRARVNRGNKP